MDERLIRAVQRGKIDEVRELLPSVANLDEEFPHNFLGYLRPQDATLLAVAAESQSSNSEIIALLLTAGATADHCSLDCVPALCWACQVGDAKKVQVLLKAGATPWPIRVFSDNSVTIEVVYQRFSQLSEKLGETVSISEERIPLFMAAKSGCSHCVQLILDAGFPVTFAEKQFGRSRTVMHLASSQEVITTLLHAGAEPCYDDFMHFVERRF